MAQLLQSTAKIHGEACIVSALGKGKIKKMMCVQVLNGIGE